MSDGDTAEKLGYCTFCGTQLGPYDQYLGCPKRPRDGGYDQHEMEWYEKKKDAPKQATKRSPEAEAFGNGLARELDENAFREAAAIKALRRAVANEYIQRLAVTPTHTQHGMRDDNDW